MTYQEGAARTNKPRMQEKIKMLLMQHWEESNVYFLILLCSCVLYLQMIKSCQSDGIKAKEAISVLL